MSNLVKQLESIGQNAKLRYNSDVKVDNKAIEKAKKIQCKALLGVPESN